jgi:hypothetical protein
MKRAIGELVHHPKVLDKFGVAARQKVLADLTWDAKAQQILSIYRAVLTGDDKLYAEASWAGTGRSRVRPTAAKRLGPHREGEEP